MKTLLLISSLLLPGFVLADPAYLLAIPGKTLYESKLEAGPDAEWKVQKGKWEAAGGVTRGAEITTDKHGAVMRLPKLPGAEVNDFVIDYEFRFRGAKSTSLTINAVKDHMARIAITPSMVSVQRDDNDHDGPDKAVIFARNAMDFSGDGWHKVHFEMVGDTLVGKVDDFTAYGSSDLFKTTKSAPGLTVGGEGVEFRNFSLKAATLNPDWEAAKAKLPAPGSKVSPVRPQKPKATK